MRLPNFLNHIAGSKENYRFIYSAMLICGLLGFLAAFTLSVEKLAIIKDPDTKLSCSINLVLNCASVMKTPQSELLGFPNSFIGIAGFAIVIALAMGGLLGVKYTRSYMLTAHIFFLLGLIFSYWLFYQSAFVIQVLCPWCLLVTAVTTVLFESMTRLNLRHNNYKLGSVANARVQSFLDKDYDRLILVAWLVLMTGVVFLKFGDGLFA